MNKRVLHSRAPISLVIFLFILVFGFMVCTVCKMIQNHSYIFSIIFLIYELFLLGRIFRINKHYIDVYTDKIEFYDISNSKGSLYFEDVVKVVHSKKYVGRSGYVDMLEFILKNNQDKDSIILTTLFSATKIDFSKDGKYILKFIETTYPNIEICITNKVY